MITMAKAINIIRALSNKKKLSKFEAKDSDKTLVWQISDWAV